MRKNEEDMEIKPNSILNNQNNELYDDAAYVPYTLLRARRVKLPNDGENWEILENNKIIFTLNGVKITKREKSILYTPEGLNILIDEYKNGNTAVYLIKKRLRAQWKMNRLNTKA